MEFINRILEDYYEGRNNDSNETIESVKTYSACIDNIIYIIGLADTQAEISAKNFTLPGFSYTFELYNAARILARQIGHTDLERQVCSRCNKQLSRVKK